LYSNKKAAGYKKIGDCYIKIVPLGSIPQECMEELVEKDTRFYRPVTVCEGQYKNRRIVVTDYRVPSVLEAEYFSSGTSYGYSRSDRLAMLLGCMQQYGFPAEVGLVHEGAHGIIDSIRDRLDDLFGSYEFIHVFEESVAQLVGIKHIEKIDPQEADRYKHFITRLSTDNVHEEAYKLVLEERERVEEMRNIVKMLKS
jgi:hypothetical protein